MWRIENLLTNMFSKQRHIALIEDSNAMAQVECNHVPIEIIGINPYYTTLETREDC